MNKPDPSAETTHFGYKDVPVDEKADHVRGVFDSVATRYDVMNDLMSAGLHRLWKRGGRHHSEPDHVWWLERQSHWSDRAQL